MRKVAGRRGFALAGALVGGAALVAWLSHEREQRGRAPVEIPAMDAALATESRALIETAAPPIDAREALSVALEPAVAPDRGHTLTGKLLDVDGTPSIGAAVWIEVDGTEPGSVESFAVSDAHAGFRFATPAEGITFHAWSATSSELVHPVRFERAGEARDLGELRLSAGGVIRGRVLGVDGRGARNVTLQARARQGSLWTVASAGHPLVVGFREARTDDDGAFVLRGLRRVAHEVLLTDDSSTPCVDGARREAVFPDGEELVFAARADGALRATVIDEPSGERISRFRVNDERDFESSDGRLELEVCCERGVTIQADGHWPTFVQGDELRALLGDEHATIALQRLPKLGSLRITAKDPAGDPVPAPRVAEWAYAFDWMVQASAGPGVVLVSQLFYGARDFYVDAPGYTLARLKLRIQKDDEVQSEVVLERSNRVRVRVLDALGLPAHGFALEVDGERRKERDFAWLRSGPHWAATDTARTNSAETFTPEPADGWLAGLPVGRYTLLVHVGADDVREFSFEVAADEERSYEFACPAVDPLTPR